MATPQPRPDHGSLNGLTGIPQRIHFGATETTYGSDLDPIIIDHFLDMLAEVALAVATRNECGESSPGSPARSSRRLTMRQMSWAVIPRS